MDRMFLIWMIVFNIIKCDIHICDEQGICEGITIQCLPNEQCIVECTRNWACVNTIIQCPANYECNIKCGYNGDISTVTQNGQRICQHMIINATQSSSLIVNATMGDIYNIFPFPRTSENTKIYCPHNNNNNNNNDGNKPCHIYCDGDDLMRYLQIYTIGGLNDVLIQTIHYQRDWCIRNADLHCIKGFNNFSCALSNYSPYQCADKPNIPNDQTCEQISIKPTISPSNSPTNQLKISLEPSISPSSIIPSENDAIIATKTSENAKEERTGGKTDNLTQSELIIIIIVCIMICVLIIIFVGASIVKKKRENHRTTNIQHEQETDSDKLLTPTNDKHGDDTDDDDDDTIEIGYDGEDKMETNTEIHGKDHD